MESAPFSDLPGLHVPAQTGQAGPCASPFVGAYLRVTVRQARHNQGVHVAGKQVSEKEARQVAEAAREAKWKLPSFGKELFLGNFRLDLIHPQPKVDPAQVEKGERFLENLRTFLVEHVDPLE